MSRVLPILFNTDMVRAILREVNYKTTTRRAIKGYIPDDAIFGYTIFTSKGYISCRGTFSDGYGEKFFKLPCQKGDILYVRETWNYGYIETSDSPGNFEAWFEQLYPNEVHGSYIEALSRYYYKADEDAPGANIQMVWRPSIHMPKEAARIWLNVTDVRVERLQKMNKMDAVKEGIDTRCCVNLAHALTKFKKLWDSTIKKSDITIYGWDANPWVWVIEFEQCEKPESEE